VGEVGNLGAGAAVPIREEKRTRKRGAETRERVARIAKCHSVSNPTSSEARASVNPPGPVSAVALQLQRLPSAQARPGLAQSRGTWPRMRRRARHPLNTGKGEDAEGMDRAPGLEATVARAHTTALVKESTPR